ncbi:MarR family winged helix-turn-helix transcriptional regulator [Paenibacillus sp. NPDC056579]|uniref:MarR family winged helix-turn-helix transcriptional regulator n=1 Tax=Paenibacillus sp. NPDC056579 TaxID=3345871 RepID=UPI0036BC3ACA
MTEELQRIAKQLMESFIQSRSRGNMMQNRGTFSQKPGEIMVLYSISLYTKDDVPGMMVSEISDKLNVTSPTVTQHIKSLEIQGLVERHADAVDRRVVRIRLTDKGKKYIQRINEARLNMFVGLVEHLGVEESQHLAETMKKASDYLLKQKEMHMRNYMENGDDEG